VGIVESEERIEGRSGEPGTRVGVEDGGKTSATKGVVGMIFNESIKRAL
jgi:hypothetical protein